MKVSVNWLKEYTAIDLSIEQLIDKIGAQLGGIDEVISLTQKYQAIVIARIMSCTKHPNADKLSLCKIDDGGMVQDVARDEDGHIQVVCGAPNVREGLLAVWLPPGTTIPATSDKDPLVLQAREIRGQVSNGMLASSSELTLSGDHAGILEITEAKAKPGDDFATAFGLDDYIIDIENKMFTHRPDLFGLLGIAREVAGIQHKSFKSPDWYINRPNFDEAGELPLTIQNKVPDLAPRFMAVVMGSIKVKPSPLWLQVQLTKVGLKPINNIVDITNYLMYLTGQPLHAYDYDKVKQRSKQDPAIVIRLPHEGEKIKLLNGKEIVPRGEAIMIATDNEAIGLGGVMGGADTEVDDSTTNIILECANFDMYSIRRTAMEHGLFTDAVTRFTKGQSFAQNDLVIAKGMSLVSEHAGGRQASTVFDSSTEKAFSHWTGIDIEPHFINTRLGLSISGAEISQLLRNVEFDVQGDGQVLSVAAPFWRTDIEIPEDIVEEVGRLYGYDHLPLDLPKRSIVPVGPDSLLLAKADLRRKLASLGANEVLSYSFVHGNLIDKAGQDKDSAFKINNALSPDLQYYRLSLTPSLLDKVHANIKAGYDMFAIFEIGKVHSKTELDEASLPREFERLAMVYAADDKLEKPGSAYYQAKAYLNQLAGHEIVPLDKNLLNGHKLMEQMVEPYDENRSGLLWNGTMPVGIVGEFKPEVARRLKLPAYTAGFEVFMSSLRSSGPPPYQALSRYPSTSQDITLKVDAHQRYAKIHSELALQLESAKPVDVQLKVIPLDIFQPDSNSPTKNLTFRVVAVSYARTLLSENVSEILDKAAEDLAASLGVQRI